MDSKGNKTSKIHNHHNNNNNNNNNHNHNHNHNHNQNQNQNQNQQPTTTTNNHNQRPQPTPTTNNPTNDHNQRPQPTTTTNNHNQQTINNTIIGGLSCRGGWGEGTEPPLGHTSSTTLLAESAIGGGPKGSKDHRTTERKSALTVGAKGRVFPEALTQVSRFNAFLSLDERWQK